MKKALVLVALLAFVGAASAADITLFWSTTGLNDAAQYYNTALQDFRPYYAPPPSPVTEVPPGTVEVFLWGSFRSDWLGYQIYGLDLRWLGTATHADNASYRQKWGTLGNKRWDGSSGIPLDGVMAAVTAAGIIFDPVDLPGKNLGTADGKFLIGAAKITGVVGDHAIMDLDAPPGGKGIAVHNPDGTTVPATLGPADLLFIPEPASMLLLGLAGLFLRRR